MVKLEGTRIRVSDLSQWGSAASARRHGHVEHVGRVQHASASSRESRALR